MGQEDSVQIKILWKHPFALGHIIAPLHLVVSLYEPIASGEYLTVKPLKSKISIYKHNI